MISMSVVAWLLNLICQGLAFSPTLNELLAFGALISATDPVSTLAVFSAKKVDPQLFYMLSGESLLNDAAGLVLFGAFAHLIEMEQVGATSLGDEVLQVLFDVAVNFFGSLVMGVLFGFLVGLALKKVDLRGSPILELSVYAMIMYAPFVLAEICHLSGIVAVLFAAMAARRYAEPNLSTFAAENSDTIFRLVSHVTETLIFLELGMSVPTLVGHQDVDYLFVLSSFLVCLISRAVNIYPLASFYNATQGLWCRQKSHEDMKTQALRQPMDEEDKRSCLEFDTTADVCIDRTIPMRSIHFLFLSGLRGAVSYGLAKMFPEVSSNKATFEVATMLTVLITTFVFGGATDIALEKLNIPVGINEDTYMQSLRKSSNRYSPSRVMRWFVRIEHRVLFPVVLRQYYQPNKMLPLPSGEETGDEFLCDDSLEITIEDHAKTMEKESRHVKRRKFSIYDFGK